MSHFGLGLISGQGLPGNDAFTKVLLHFDGTNGGTSYPDTNAGGSSHTWTNNAGSVTNTSNANPKFGPTALSIPFTAGAEYVSTPDHADFDVGSGAFTVDFWFNPFNSGASYSTSGLAGQGVETSFTGFSWLIYRNSGGTVTFFVSNGVSGNGPTSTTVFNTNAWFHIAAVKTAAGVLKLFVNGIQEGGDVSWNYAVPNVSTALAVGRAGTSTTHTTTFGSFDEFRFSVGIARWTANFTPPVSAYT